MGEVIATIEDVAGHYPARLRLPVTEESGVVQRGLIYALRSRHYRDEATACCAYAAQDMTPLDLAAYATSGGRAVVRHQNLSTAWTPILLTDIAQGALTHTGTNRLWALVYSTSAAPPRLRAVYDVGDMVFPEENDAVAIPGASNFYYVDLGELRLDPSPVGDHRWRGQLQGQGTIGGENVSIADVFVLNTDEAYGVLRASLSADPGLVEYVARDEFNQSAGALASKTLPVGGTWTGAGDSDDFAVEATGKSAQRTATGDAGLYQGRYAIAGASVLTDTVAQVDIKWSAVIGGVFGVLARYTNTNNWLQAYVNPGNASNGGGIVLEKRVAGSSTVVAAYQESIAADANQLYTIRLLVTEGGHVQMWYFPAGGAPRLFLQALDSDLASGGALDDGKCGIYDEVTGGVACTRNFKNYLAWVPETDAVLYPNRSTEIRWDGVYRESADGEGSGSLVPFGDLPRLPPSGLEGRPCEVCILTSDGDFDQLPDSGDSDISVTAHSRLSYLTTPPGPPFPSEDTIPSEDLIP